VPVAQVGQETLELLVGLGVPMAKLETSRCTLADPHRGHA
jgi:hypothetical protein